MNLCRCGCGTAVKKRFVRGHCARVKNPMHYSRAAEKISKLKSGDKNPMRDPEVAARVTATKISNGDYSGPRNPNWSGGKRLEYERVHRWLRSAFSATKCESCGTDGPRLAWAFLGVPGQCLKDRDAYCVLCPACHGSFDSMIKEALS